MTTRRFDARDLPDHIVAAWRQLMKTEVMLDHPLLSPTWVQTVAAVQEKVEVAVLTQDNVPRGFLPFERRGRQAYPVGGSLSDHQALIASPTLQCEIEQLLRECGLTALHYDHLPASTAEQPWFAAYSPRTDDAAIVALQAGFDAYWRERREASCSWTRQIERKGRKLGREVGPLRFIWHDDDPASFKSLIDWKRGQLRASRFVDMFACPWVCPLLDRLVTSEAEECRGVLSTLFAGKRLVAVHLGIRNNHVMVSSIPTHSPEFSAYSPGAVLHVELAKAAAERQIQSIDLGRGLNPLKRALGSTMRKLAIGTVDLRPSRRWARACWFRLRDAVHALPLGNMPLRAYREVRRWISLARR